VTNASGRAMENQREQLAVGKQWNIVCSQKASRQ